MAKKGQKYRKYTVDFKISIVEKNLTEGISIKDIGEEYGIHPSLIRTWRKIYLREGTEGLKPKKKGRQPGDTKKNFDSELERLQYENAQLKLEVLRLKKTRSSIRGDATSEKEKG